MRFWNEGFPLEINCVVRFGSATYKISDMRMSKNEVVIAKIR